MAFGSDREPLLSHVATEGVDIETEDAREGDHAQGNSLNGERSLPREAVFEKKPHDGESSPVDGEKERVAPMFALLVRVEQIFDFFPFGHRCARFPLRAFAVEV